MLERALDFATTLQRRVEDGPVNYIFLGDFNIMGMKYRTSVNATSSRRRTLASSSRGRSGRK